MSDAARLIVLVMPLLWAPACMHSPQAELRAAGEIQQREARPDQLLDRARAFAAVADYTRAEQYLMLALASGAEEQQVAPSLIEVCIKDQRYRAAIQHAEQYLRKHPRQYRLRFVGATLHAAIGDVARAREELEKVLSVNPEYAEAHYALAVLLRDEIGNHSQADLHFRAYLRLAPRGNHAEEATDSLLEVMP
jgi:tetratricopeptide (TPR) repeat protein